MKLKPVVKWLGGKTQLIDKILSKIQLTTGRFVEPFVGGGSVFLYIQPEKLHINDINPYLMNMYQVIKENPEELIIDLQTHQITEAYYYQIRREQIGDENKIREASKFIFLNKTCFRGVYRENSKGEFNVPFGNYKHPLICDMENIRNISTYFNAIDVVMTNTSFENVLSSVQPDDFVYLDPPYMPMKTTQFTKYNKTDFGVENQRRLHVLLTNVSFKFLQSNSPSPLIIQLYEPFIIDIFTGRRSISIKQGENTLEPNEILINN